MRVVLDTNVIVSALLSPHGVPSQIFHYWELLYFDLLVSEKSLDELMRVMEYPKIRKRLRSTDEEQAQFVDFLREKALWVTHHEVIQAVQSDMSDNIYLEIALAGQARFLISGDQHLLRLKEFRGIHIIAPTEFLALLTLPTSGAMPTTSEKPSQ
jgi:putative PIN family toxin of toxin-antitoxin system